jgi:hypothetical protein
LKLVDGAVAVGKLAADAVAGQHVVDGAVATANLASGAVTGAAVVDDAITSRVLAPLSVAGTNVARGAIGWEQLSDDVLSLFQEMALNLQTIEELVDEINPLCIIGGAKGSSDEAGQFCSN